MFSHVFHIIVVASNISLELYDGNTELVWNSSLHNHKVCSTWKVLFFYLKQACHCEKESLCVLYQMHQMCSSLTVKAAVWHFFIE